MRESFWAIAITEYMSFFGHGPNYLAYLDRQPYVITALLRTFPYRTARRIVDATNSLLRMSIDQRIKEVSHLMGFDWSIPALFNGIITDQLHNGSAWKTAYNNKECCTTIIGLIINLSRITNKVHSFYVQHFETWSWNGKRTFWYSSRQLPTPPTLFHLYWLKLWHMHGIHAPSSERIWVDCYLW
jgi:hypothetical protein